MDKFARVLVTYVKNFQQAAKSRKVIFFFWIWVRRNWKYLQSPFKCFWTFLNVRQICCEVSNWWISLIFYKTFLSLFTILIYLFSKWKTTLLQYNLPKKVKVLVFCFLDSKNLGLSFATFLDTQQFMIIIIFFAWLPSINGRDVSGLNIDLAWNVQSS